MVADTSTVAPETVRGIEGDGARHRRVPWSTPRSRGACSSVEGGTILVMAGGEPRPTSSGPGRRWSRSPQRIILLGPLGSGAIMKLAVNAMVFGLNQTLAEALVLAEKAGVERALAYEVFATSAVGRAVRALQAGRATSTRRQAPVAFALDLVAKDLDLAAALAAEVGADVPQLVATNRRVVGEAIAAGLGSDDMSALAVHLRASADRAEG